MIKQRKQLGNRPKAFWGAIIPSLISSVANITSGIITTSAQARAQKRALEQQQQLAQQQAQISRDNQLANTLNNSANADASYDNSDQYNLKYRNGGVKRIGSNNIVITDGGNAKKIGQNTYLLRGGSHETINETGQTGIGINVGGNEIEAEGGEVAQKKGNALRIFSAQPILNGISPAQAVKAGVNKDSVFNAQQRFKKNNGLKDDGSKAKWGTKDYINAAKEVGSYLPVIGTLEDAYELYRNPSLEQAGWTILGLASDIIGGRAIVKGLKTARLASKAYKANKNIINARKMINARNFRNNSIVTGTILPGTDNIVQNTIVEPLKKKYGGLTSKDRGSSKHPYPNVASNNFAGNNRTYPIPTKADAIDALRLAGLHGRSDVRSKVYNKYPELRKKAKVGTKADSYYDWAKNVAANLDISLIDPTYDYRAYYNSVTPYERNLIRYAPQGTHFTDIGKTSKHPTFSNESKYSNKKTPGGTWNGNVFVPAIWQFANDGNKVRNRYMKNSGEGYFDGRKDVFPKYNLGGRPKAGLGNFVKGTWNFLKQPRNMIDNMVVLAIANQLYNPNSATNKKKGKFGGAKSFNGAGSGGTWTNVKPAIKKFNNFNEAYDDAVDRGASTFKFGNKLYNTKAEANPIREFNNRFVGNNRDTIMVNDRGKEYGIDYGPINSSATMFPLVYDTYNRKRKALGGRPKAKNGILATPKLRNNIPVPNPYRYSFEDINNNSFLNSQKSNGLYTQSNYTPYIGRQSEFVPATQDYIGLGIDTLATLGSGLFTRSAYNNLDFDYNLPNYVDETPVAFDTTYHNEAQRANIERNRINARNTISGNTASAQNALNRMQQSDTSALMETNKLLDEKSNKEVELRNQNAANEQAVRARNAAARNQYYQNVAAIKNAALEAKNEAALAKAQSISSDLSGLSQAWTNFATSVENRYNNRQNEAIIAATSKEPAVLSNALQFGYNFSPEILANIYRSSNNDKLKRLALSRLSNSERRKFGIV